MGADRVPQPGQKSVDVLFRADVPWGLSVSIGCSVSIYFELFSLGGV